MSLGEHPCDTTPKNWQHLRCQVALMTCLAKLTVVLVVALVILGTEYTTSIGVAGEYDRTSGEEMALACSALEEGAA